MKEERADFLLKSKNSFDGQLSKRRKESFECDSSLNGKRAGRKISLNSSVYRSRGTGRNIKIGKWRHKR